jgi:DDE superfamily endonuclease/Helix-turn-helix of DDE superfamily endonuclease
VYRLPGLSLRAAAEVVHLAEREFVDWEAGTGRPKALPVGEALRLTLCRLRRNLTYAELGVDFGVSASTAWEYAQVLVGFLADLLGCPPDGLAGLVAGKVCLIDGSLVPVLNWRHRRDLFSGKHRRYGMNVQVLVDLHGRLIGASRAFPGSWHDMRCFTAAGWAELVARSGGAIADAGYQGSPAVTPIKKRPGIDRTETDRQFNTALAQVRVANEWGIAHLKNWRILSTRYRSQLHRLDTDLQAVLALQQLNERYSERRLHFARIKKTRLSE